MSSILKALEKAEESNGTRRTPGDSDLIRSRKSRPVWIMPSAVLCAAVLATLATFTAMGGFSRHTPPAPAPVAKAAAPVAAAAAAANPALETPATTVVQSLPIVPEGAPVVPAPKAAPPAPQVAAPLAAPKAAPVASVKAAPMASVKAAPAAGLKAAPVAHQKAAPVASLKTVPLSARKVPAAASGRASARPAPQQIKTTQVTPVAAAPPAPPAPPAAPARPELKVSGIAWQNNGASSFAVVNGRAVLQGSMVDGYKVQEIRHDAVRFSGSGGTFEVPLGDDK
jgi:hypothetical protein